jgi:hypothetical protein
MHSNPDKRRNFFLTEFLPTHLDGILLFGRFYLPSGVIFPLKYECRICKTTKLIRWMMME